MPLPSVPHRLMHRIARLLLPNQGGKTLSTQTTVTLVGEMLELPAEMLPVELTLGKHGPELILAADAPFAPDDDPNRGYVIFDPETPASAINGFLRLEPNTSVTLGRHSPLQEQLFHYSAAVNKRHLSVMHIRDRLFVKDLDNREGTTLSLVKKEKNRTRLHQLRLENMNRLRNILETPLPLAPEPALALLHQVNGLPWDKSLRPRNSRGLAGGLVKLPREITPIILGDLHANLDNLLTVLSVNGFLHGLEKGTACLILLGDSVHCERESCLDEMATSMVMMDVIFQLMVHFPQRVLYLRGNHDSFGQEVYKGGVPQGVLWEKHLRDNRGEDYVAAMNRFYENLPVMAVSRDFITCHGAPPNAQVTPGMIVDIHKYEGLARSILWNRIQRPHFRNGYTQGDVKRLRECFNLPADTPLIVAHTPMAREETVWSHVRGMDHHHIVYSGRPRQVALFTRIGEHMQPQVYFSDPLTDRLQGVLT